MDGQGDVAMGNTLHFAPVAAPPTPTPAGVPYPHYGGARPSPTPVSMPQYGGHTAMHHTTPPMPQTPHYPGHQPPFNGYAPPYNPAPVPMAHHQPHPHPHSHHPPPMNPPMPAPFDPSQRLAPSPARAAAVPVPVPVPMPMPAAPAPGMHPQPNTHNPPRPVEVYTLDDALNESIPAEIREQFQRDEQGRVLFFTQPPLDRAHRGLSSESAGLGHSVRYLADRAWDIEDRRAKRRARDELRKEEERKRHQLDENEAKALRAELMDAASDVILAWVDSMNKENEVLKKQYDGWSVRDEDINRLATK
jgi:chromatin structure-remodeling complex subunit RSC1/2